MSNTSEKETVRDKFIEIYTSFIKRDGASELLEYLDANGFFVAPASTKYHGNYKGGLCEHSLNVYYDLIDELRCLYGSHFDKRYSYETIAIVSLLHDVCKIDKYIEVEKNVKNPDTGVWETKKVFDYNKEQVRLGHGSSSIYTIQDFIKLTQEEKQAIHWHMAAFDISPYNSTYDMGDAFSKNTLAFALHIADMTATYIDENDHFVPITDEELKDEETVFEPDRKGLSDDALKEIAETKIDLSDIFGKKEDYDAMNKQEYAFLDSKDLKPIIEENSDKTVYEIMQIIDDIFSEEYIENQEIDDSELFNTIDRYEFAEYINKRYGVKCTEEVEIYFSGV